MSEVSAAVSSESDEQLIDIPNLSPSPWRLSWVCYFSVVTHCCNIHGMGNLTLHH